MRKRRLSRYKQSRHKTFIGRISKGFDFLGYHFNNHGLSLAKISINKHVERLRQLYKQQH